MAQKELPILGYDPVLNAAPFIPAGGIDHQTALNDDAWEMMDSAIGGIGNEVTRLSADWLTRHGWRVVILPDDIGEEEEEHLCTAIRRHGNANLVVVVVSPGEPRPSAVFRFPAASLGFRNAIAAATWQFLAIFPEDRSMAIHVHMDGFIAVAGPPDFLRDAVDLPTARAGREEVIEIAQSSGHGAWLPPELAHYAPFLLDGA
jgi:hypothetical protein